MLPRKRLQLVAPLAALVILGTAPLALHDGAVHVERRGPLQPSVPHHAHFGALAASGDTRSVADWVVRSGDNGSLPFLIIDKQAAAVYVFTASGRAQASAPVLLGMAKGDRFAPGAAEKDMYEMSTSERITPAGRFVAQPGTNTLGQSVIWILYDAGIAMHAVLDVPGQHRAQRLATPTADDNRISYGCVNVPVDFYRDVVGPLFERTNAVVYVLPDSGRLLDMLARN